MSSREVKIPANEVTLPGTLAIPPKAKSVIVFAHGSGSSRLSPRNLFVAEFLQNKGFGTLLFDLLTPQEDEIYENRFNIPLITQRLLIATKWLRAQPEAKKLKIGYFGASTGAAAALVAAANLPKEIFAVVSRGGRPDMALEYLPKVSAPTLLIVGGLDDVVIQLNKQALKKITAAKELSIVPRATHLFEETGALEQVAKLAADWFAEH